MRVWGASAVLAIALASLALRAEGSWADEPLLPVPTQAELDVSLTVDERERMDARRALGRELFWSRRLSDLGKGDGLTGLSCAMCHAPEQWGTSGTRYVADARGQPVAFHVPSVFNAALNTRQLWGGFERTMEAAANRAMTKLMGSPLPEGNNPDELLARLSDAPSEMSPGKTFRMLFVEAYAGTPLAPAPGKPVQRAAILDALAEYMRSITPRNAVFDRWLRSDKTDPEMKEGPKNGYRLFKQYGCVSCHQGVNVGGNMLAKFGVMNNDDPPGVVIKPDAPPEAVENDPAMVKLVERRKAGLAYDTNGGGKVFSTTSDEGVFKVPSLRNVEHTGPYFHDGRVDRLEDAVRIMAWRQLDRLLTDDEVADIVAFLRTLSGEPEAAAKKPAEMQ